MNKQKLEDAKNKCVELINNRPKDTHGFYRGVVNILNDLLDYEAESKSATAASYLGKRREGKIFRWWRELWHPELKCKRIGHIEIKDRVRIRKNYTGYGAVVEDYKATLIKCKRCGETLGEPIDLKFLTSYSSCSMPGNYWDEMREKGYTIVQ